MKHRKFAFVIIMLSCFLINAEKTIGTEEKVPFMYEKDNGTFNFTALIDGLNYTWNFGDGSVAYGKNVSHSYVSPGSYEVKLTVKRKNDTINYSKMINTDNIPPTADFYYSPEYPYTFVTIFFFDNSSDPDGYIINWTWNFGDGNISYEKNPTHVYTKAGKYNVTLMVIDNDSEAAHITKQIVIKNRKPVAKFYWTKDDNIIRFHADYPFDASYDEDGVIVNYTWNFGDGSIAYGIWVEHEYTQDKLYNVTLTVIDDDGGVDSFTRQIHNYNKLPIVDFSFSPSEPTDLDNITFKSKSYDPDGTIVNYTWEFGDGGVGYNETEIHRYADNGFYSVWLWAVDDEGCFNNTNKQIYVKNVPPVANFTWEPIYPIPNRNVTFNASLSYDLDGSIVSWHWEFGDGGVGEGMIINHNYTKNGFYNVTLVVVDNDGDNDSITKKLFIADFYVDENVYDPLNHTWNKIQDAIDNATDGALIYVRKGTYNEDVVVDKSLKILAENATLIGKNFSFHLIADDIIIQNFIIMQSKKGIIIDGDDTVVIECNLKENEMGIIINGNGSYIENVISKADNASLLINGSHNIIKGNFQGNIFGCKLYGNENQIKNSTFSGLYAIYLSGEHNIIENNIISDSIYGMYILQENEIEDNRIERCSFGMQIVHQITIGYNEFIENTYAIKSSVPFSLENAKFIDNQIAISGDVMANGINISGGSVGIVTFDGHIYNSYINGLDKGIEIKSDAVIENLTIINCNEGVVGGGMASINRCKFVDNYVGVMINSTITNSSFTGNFYSIKVGNSSVYNSTFYGNDYAAVLITNSTTYHNTFIGNDISLNIVGEGNEIVDNEILSNEYGILIEASDNAIRNNSIANNTYGIKIVFAPLNTLAWNKMENNQYNFDMEGSKIKHFYQSINESNTINGREMIYLINASNLQFNGEYG
ncbi:MAG: hypothetical protein DRN29_06020, partial [Thermoplasmata archaeon]